MPKPSIKGAAITQLVDDVRKLVTSARLTECELESRLDGADLAILDGEVRSAAWYDIRSYERLAELLRDVEGEGRNEYVRERGYATARRFIAAGVYPQMEYLNRTEVSGQVERDARLEAFGRDLKLLVSMTASMLNFTRWSGVPDPEYGDRYRVEVRDARAFPDVLGWSSEGFINAMATQHGAPDLWRWNRPEPDFIVFRMIRPL